MNKSTTFKVGAIALIALGIIHLGAHFGMTPPEDAKPLLEDMNNYKIELMGTHSLKKFHDGFSIMMAFLMIAFGVLAYQLRDAILMNRSVLWTTFIVALIGFGIAFIFFHVLAYGFLLFSTLCFGYTLAKK